jgi:hypothetical protein
VPGFDVYFLADPAAVEHVLVKNPKNYRKPEFLTGPVRLLRLIESRRRAGPAASDLLDLLLGARDEESGTGMSDQQLKDEVLTLLFAGHDTTTAGLCWAWHLLARHPETQEALHDEVAGRLRRSSRARGPQKGNHRQVVAQDEAKTPDFNGRVGLADGT